MSETKKHAFCFDWTPRAERCQAHSELRRAACDHDWIEDPTCTLIDVCAKCGEERA